MRAAWPHSRLGVTDNIEVVPRRQCRTIRVRWDRGPIISPTARLERECENRVGLIGTTIPADRYRALGFFRADMLLARRRPLQVFLNPKGGPLWPSI